MPARRQLKLRQWKRPPKDVPRAIARKAVVRADRVVVAVTFLAMLELVKGRELSVEQEEPFGPIVCRSLGAA